ncbi:MAG: hypothetical protein ACOX6L_12680 [Syntrophomonadaceae bacterium]|jgi:hypothetical protein
MMKKLTSLFWLLSLLGGLASCKNNPLHRVELTPAEHFVVPDDYNISQQTETKAAYDNQDSFLLVVFSQYCSCSLTFHSALMDYINDHHLPYYQVLNDGSLLYDFGLPIAEAGIELPIFAIYERGDPYYWISYDSDHPLFEDAQSFEEWTSSRITFIPLSA